MSSTALPEFLRNEALQSQIAYMEEQPLRDAAFGVASNSMHPALQERLAKLGLSTLFSHQAMAYDAAMSGEDVVVVTGTNSGKTLCYNLPALQWSLTEPAVRMLYLFPTKALAQDQAGKLEALCPGPQVRIGTYDGDTPLGQRASMRKLAHIVLTNPDMLHVGILPGHELWTKFLKSLRLIVIDEMHVYRGVFGSNVGGVLRRLLRLCEWHRCRPQIVACSATIGNPMEVFEKLTGRTATVIADDGSPKGKRTFIMWNPPLIGAGQRMSSNLVSSEVMATLVEAGRRVLTFNRARVSAELVLRYTRKRVKEGGRVSPDKIESYRAGYTAKERRQIERSLFDGSLLGLSATNAMELGVDVGGLDAVIMNGYPGSIASFYQQSGRAGRGTRDGLAIMVAHDDPLEQFLIRQPELLLERESENVALNPANPQILSQQLLCASHERPLAPHETERFGPGAIEVAEGLDRSGELQFRNGMFFYPSHEPPAPKINIRGSGGQQVRLLVDGEELGSMELWRAMRQAHEGAVYLHRGATFVVRELDLETGCAHVTQSEVDYYTQAIVQSTIEPHVTARRADFSAIEVALRGVKVTSLVLGYRKKSLDGDSVRGVVPLELPPSTFETVAVQFDFPTAEPDADLIAHYAGVHGFEHAAMTVAPLIAGCDRSDLGSAWYVAHHETLKPTVFAYDQTPGGVGLCDKLFDELDAWTRGALQLLTSCKCDDGCPACLLSSRCEANNESLDKKKAIEFLQMLR